MEKGMESFVEACSKENMGILWRSNGQNSVLSLPRSRVHKRKKEDCTKDNEFDFKDQLGFLTS